MPTLATDISKKKQARAIFLFDSSRTNIVLLKSNKKLTSGPLYLNIFVLKNWKKHILSTKNVLFCDEKSTLAAPISKNK